MTDKEMREAIAELVAIGYDVVTAIVIVVFVDNL